MSIFHTPTVGSIGQFAVGAPFDTVIEASTMYTCQAVRSLTDMIAGEEDPFTTIYTPLGISEANFKLDIKEKVSIVTLTAGGTKFIDIPDRYINSGPVLVGKTYQSKALSINLSSLPKNDIDLDALSSDIAALIHSSIGITADITILETSPEFKVAYDIHNTSTATRLANVSNKKSYKTKYDELLIVENSNALHIAELEQYIKDKL